MSILCSDVLKLLKGKKYKKVIFKVLEYSVTRMSDIVYLFFGGKLDFVTDTSKSVFK